MGLSIEFGVDIEEAVLEIQDVVAEKDVEGKDIFKNSITGIGEELIPRDIRSFDLNVFDGLKLACLDKEHVEMAKRLLNLEKTILIEEEFVKKKEERIIRLMKAIVHAPFNIKNINIDEIRILEQQIETNSNPEVKELFSTYRILNGFN